jgi:hypothetical protein
VTSPDQQIPSPQSPSSEPESFDAYYRWLGIPPEDQPPNHYRLLGIKLFEEDRDVIDMAAARQSVHLRTFQLSRHVAQSQKLLNEVAGAKICLLDPEKKAAYDATLRQSANPSAEHAGPRSWMWAGVVGAAAGVLIFSLARLFPAPKRPAARTPRTIAAATQRAVHPPKPAAQPQKLTAASPAPLSPSLPTATTKIQPQSVSVSNAPVPSLPLAATGRQNSRTSPPIAGPLPQPLPTPIPASAPAQPPPGWVKIVNRKTAVGLWAPGGSTVWGRGATIVQIEPTGEYFKIRCQGSGEYLSLTDWALKSGQAPRGHPGVLRVVPNSDDVSLLWKFEPVEDCWRIVNRVSRRCLQPNNPSLKGAGVCVQAPPRDGALEQQWRFEPIKPEVTSGPKNDQR